MYEYHSFFIYIFQEHYFNLLPIINTNIFNYKIKNINFTFVFTLGTFILYLQAQHIIHRTNCQTMDLENKEEYIFSFILLKCIGLYQIIDPNTKKLFGYNLYHIFICLFGLILFCITSMFPISLYYWSKDFVAIVYTIGCSENLIFSYCKMLLILYYSQDIWNCMDVTNINFITYEKYNRNVFKNWKKISHRVTLVYCIMSILILTMWILYPLIFNTTFTIKNLDGSYSNYKLNVLNMYLPISDEVYNHHYAIIYSVEIIGFITYFYFLTIFDIIVLVISCALLCQLSTISNAISSLGHGGSIIDNTGMYIYIYIFQ